jgi:hypothetical protein
MYNIHPTLEPKCTINDIVAKNPIQLGASGNVRPCNFYGSLHNWEQLEQWCKQKGLDIKKLNIKKSTMEEIYESDVFKAILDGHGTLDLPHPCKVHCTKNKKSSDELAATRGHFGYKETNKGFGLDVS